MSIVVKQEDVLSLAKKMRIRSKHRNIVVLQQQVQWRFDRRRIILKWKCLPEKMASLIMTFLGNESEMQSTIQEKQVAKERTKWLRRFKKNVELWNICNVNINFIETGFLVVNQVSAEASIMRNREMMSEIEEEIRSISIHLVPCPDFPWI
jgi:hypothetical protein